MKSAGLLLLVVFSALLLGCKKETQPPAQLQYQVPPAGYPVSVEPSGSTNVDNLVAQLVSQRPAPYPSGYADPPFEVVFSKRYSTPEVEMALKKLNEMGPPIFPALVKFLGDDRYSYSDVWAAWLNHGVGSAVVEVLSDGHYLHSGYRGRETPSGSGGRYLSFKDYLSDRGAEAWAEWAKSKSRLEIQMDFIDWCVLKENERGYIDEAQKKEVLGRYESARDRVKKEYDK